MSEIIMPGDPNWDKPLADKVSPPEKLPDELLENAFREVVDEVKEKLDNEISLSPLGAVAGTSPLLPPKGVQYKFCSPSRQKFYEIPVQQEMKAILTQDLPKAWERECFVGRISYGITGRVRTSGFRKGDEITINSCTLFPGVGLLYGFKEGSRGGYGVRPDQVEIQASVIQTGVDNVLDNRQDTEIQQARTPDNPE